MEPVYYSFARILPLAWLSTLTVPGGTGHQLEVPTRKADPAPPRARSGDLTEVKGAHTPAGRSATPTPPHAGEQQCQRQPGVSPTWAVTASVLSSRRPPAHTPPHTSNPRGNFSGCPSNSGFTSVDSMTSGVFGFLVSPPPGTHSPDSPFHYTSWDVRSRSLWSSRREPMAKGTPAARRPPLAHAAAGKGTFASASQARTMRRPNTEGPAGSPSPWGTSQTCLGRVPRFCPAGLPTGRREPFPRLGG